MLKIKILSVGKTKETWLEEALAEYEKRLQGASIQIEYSLARQDSQLVEWASKESQPICLDPQGTLMNSEKFAEFLMQSIEKGGSRLTFIIGGADGLPPALKNQQGSISLSPLTFTHQLTRLVLIEQIYRSFEILKGSAYHK